MSSSMYSLKPIIKKCEIEVPTCMYKLKNIYGENNNSTDSANQPSGMEALENRQEIVIQQLKDLKQQLFGMHKELNICCKPAQPTTNKPINKAYLQDIVINANPKNVPYSLLALRNLWKCRLDMEVSCFTHSTVSELTPEATNFQKAITENPPPDVVPVLKVSLIWKNITTKMELITSPTLYVPIYGEVNIIRYLARVGPSEYNYDNELNSFETDAILDTCYLLVRSVNTKERQALLRVLNNRLGKSDFYGDGTISVGDIAVSSTLKQTPTALKELTPPMAKWLKTVTDIVGY